MSFTEADWLAGTNVNVMFGNAGRGGKPNDKRLAELLCCAACRMNPGITPWVDAVITAFERHADGGPEVGFIGQQFGQAPDAASKTFEPLLGRLHEGFFSRILWLTGGKLGEKNMAFGYFIPTLRCLIGNPFRPLEGAPSPALRRLGEALYAQFPHIDAPALSVFADALEEANHLDAAAHCRSTPTHFRGCHAIDWSTGRSQP